MYLFGSSGQRTLSSCIDPDHALATFVTLRVLVRVSCSLEPAAHLCCRFDVGLRVFTFVTFRVLRCTASLDRVDSALSFPHRNRSCVAQTLLFRIQPFFYTSSTTFCATFPSVFWLDFSSIRQLPFLSFCRLRSWPFSPRHFRPLLLLPSSGLLGAPGGTRSGLTGTMGIHGA